MPTRGAAPRVIGGARKLGRTSIAPLGAARDALPPEVAYADEPWWAFRARVLARLGRADDAQESYARAAGLAQAPAVRAFRIGRRDGLRSCG